MREFARIGDPAPFRHTLHEGAPALAPTRHALRHWLQDAGAADADVDDVLIATSEACTNALEHAYPDLAPGVVEVHATIRAGLLELMVSDVGNWREEPLDRGNRGHGKKLMEHLMDRTMIESGPSGTVVRLHKELGLDG